MFPNDAITVFEELNGPQTVNITGNNGPNTILSVAIQQSNVSSDTEIRCGGDTVAKNYATNFSAVPMKYDCDDDIILTKTGNDDASIIVTYVPYFLSDYSTTTQYGYNPTPGIASSGDIALYGAMSAGEILLAFLLLGQIFMLGLYMLIKSIGKITTRKKYIEYTTGDVPITQEP